MMWVDRAKVIETIKIVYIHTRMPFFEEGVGVLRVNFLVVNYQEYLKKEMQRRI